MMARSGSPDEAARQERHRTLRGGGLFVAERTERFGRILHRFVTLRAWIPVFLVGHESERLRLRSLCSGGAGPGFAFLLDALLADSVCPKASRGGIGCTFAALVVEAGAPSRTLADRVSTHQIPGIAGGRVGAASIRQCLCVLSEPNGRSGL